MRRIHGAVPKPSSTEEGEEPTPPLGTGLHEELEEMYQKDSEDKANFLEESPHGAKWHTSFHSCLVGETEVITRQGIFPIGELVGEAEILVPYLMKRDGLTRNGRSQRETRYRRGGFRSVPVRSFGRAEVFDIHLRRGRQEKVVTATSNHRWYLKDTSVVATIDLQNGCKLKGLKAKKGGMIQMVPFAVAQGFVFGDDGKMLVTQIQSLPRLWKLIPSYDESSAFLLSWLAGYFAADGSVSESGQATLSSASLEAIQFVRGVLSICGVGYGKVCRSGGRIGFSLNINIRDLPDWFFILPKHRGRAERQLAKKLGVLHEWQVESIEPTGRKEEVFCPTVPGSQCFGLSDELLTGNSSFPGSDPLACSRKALYRMMAFPPDGPTDTGVMAAGEAGSDLENRIVERWHRFGVLLSAPPQADHQTVFANKDVWLTCALDAVLDRRPHFKYVHPVDVKSVNHAALLQIAKGQKTPDPRYIRQVHVQTFFCRTFHDLLVPKEKEFNDLLPAVGGSLYYVSRQMPRTAVEVWIPYDGNELVSGIKRLQDWKENFEGDELPERNPDWRWMMDPCRSCNFKQTCRKDCFDGVSELSKSNGVNLSKERYKEYDTEIIVKDVLDRWEGREEA